MTREEGLTLEPGERVIVQYLGYEIEADVVEVEPYGRYGPQRGWIMVEQITDFEDLDQRPRYEALMEFMSRPGEPRPLMPFVSLYG